MVEGYTPLHTAAAGGNSAQVARLIKQGADMNVRVPSKATMEGYTPLHLSKTEGVAELLLANGANKEARTKNWLYASGLRCRPKELGCMRVSLEERCNPNAQGDDGSTPLMNVMMTHTSAENLNAIADVLLKYHAEINARNGAGNTALYAAAIFGLTAQVKFLLDRGANPNLSGETGELPLHFDWGDADMLRALLLHGADPGR